MPNLFFTVFKIFLQIFGVLLFVFFLLRVLPGHSELYDGPRSVLVEQTAHTENSVQTAQAAPVSAVSGGVLEFFKSYSKELWPLLKGDFGYSLYQKDRSVKEILFYSFKFTMPLYLISFILIIFFGFIISFLCVLYKDHFLRSVLDFITIISLSLPTLVLAPLSLFFIAYELDLVPTRGLETPQSYFLPIFLISFRPTFQLKSILTRYWEDELSRDYVLYARAKGLSEVSIILKHALKNGINPVLNYIGPLGVHILSGSFFVEILFLIPGPGQLLVQSISERDYPVILAMTFVTSVVLVIVMQGIQLLNHQIDPREASY